ncbi:hypothetical protein TNCV_322481 [Trichonephila clavipes]|nr:hypothetical protein TNCV_322481 [Trichonephila clavipes]
MACERKLFESEATTGFFVLLGTKGKKETLEWCMKANLIASRYECPRCKKEMRLTATNGVAAASRKIIPTTSFGVSPSGDATAHQLLHRSVTAKLPTGSAKIMPTWLYHQHFAMFPLNRQYNRLKWAGHLARMNEDRCCKKCFLAKPMGNRSRGRTLLRWIDSVENSKHFKAGRRHLTSFSMECKTGNQSLFECAFVYKGRAQVDMPLCRFRRQYEQLSQF